jgi:hypothetical protein
MSGFWAGTIPPWAWVLYVCAAGIFLILVIVAELHGRKVGYRQHEEDQADARDEAVIESWRVRSEAEGVAVVKRAGMAWVQAHLAPLELPELPPPLELEEWAVPLEYPPAEETFYAWEPWSLSAGTTLEEEVRAMIANADACPSVRWLASLEPGQ